MKLSASHAAKKVGKSTQTITRAIKSGRLSGEKLDGGGYAIEPVELFRVWPKVSNDSSATPEMAGSGTPQQIKDLEHQLELLRKDYDHEKNRADTATLDRDRWHQEAFSSRLLLEDKSEKPKGVLGRWFGRS